ncbi:MAG: 2-amino-4-hydroxy-6-hydroxymethyldihydropteridine diphosphokinase [Caulobacterales bacterium]|uniref:2-amino-4-hydroxy-6- hydroxymethyldihydropteridine diphosphokinase n=1 Tax=Glycocaulis sp. TaxID=1969725 RepID=UPI003F9EC835
MSIYIAFGSNQALGDTPSRGVLAQACKALEARGVVISRRASLWHSPAWPDPSDPAYLNSVAEIETQLDPGELLACLHDIEAGLGRVRSALNAPRTLDLDLIDFAGEVHAGPPGPVLPHPRAHIRAFVLLPLREIAPRWIHPVSGEGIEALIARLPRDEIAATRRVGPFEA